MPAGDKTQEIIWKLSKNIQKRKDKKMQKTRKLNQRHFVYRLCSGVLAVCLLFGAVASHASMALEEEKRDIPEHEISETESPYRKRIVPRENGTYTIQIDVYIKDCEAGVHYVIEDTLGAYADFSLTEEGKAANLKAEVFKADGERENLPSESVEIAWEEKTLMWEIPSELQREEAMFRLSYEVAPSQEAFDDYAERVRNQIEAPDQGDAGTGETSEHQKGYFTDRGEASFVSRVRDVSLEDAVTEEKKEMYQLPRTVLQVPVSEIVLSSAEAVTYSIICDETVCETGVLNEENGWENTVAVSGGKEGHHYSVTAQSKTGSRCDVMAETEQEDSFGEEGIWYQGLLPQTSKVQITGPADDAGNAEAEEDREREGADAEKEECEAPQITLSEPVCQKHIRKNSDGTYRMELTARGDKKTVTLEKPVDVILLFDASWSMMSGLKAAEPGLARRGGTKKAKDHVPTEGRASRLKDAYEAATILVDAALAHAGNRVALVKASGDAKRATDFSGNRTKVHEQLSQALSFWGNAQDAERESLKAPFVAGGPWGTEVKKVEDVLKGSPERETHLIVLTDGKADCSPFCKEGSIKSLYHVSIGQDSQLSESCLKHAGGRNLRTVCYDGKSKEGLERIGKAMQGDGVTWRAAHCDMAIEEHLSAYADFAPGCEAEGEVSKDGRTFTKIEKADIHIDKKDGQITWKLPEDASLGETYRLSFPVVPTQKAFDAYAKDRKAPHTGDAETGKDSAGKEGFFADTEAVFTYREKIERKKGDASEEMTVGETKTLVYPRPVIEVPASFLHIKSVQKKDAKRAVICRIYQDHQLYKTVELNAQNAWEASASVPAGRKGHTYQVQMDIQEGEDSVFAAVGDAPDPSDFQPGNITRAITLCDDKNAQPEKKEKWITFKEMAGKSVSVEKTWVDDGINRPESVEITLRRDGEKVEKDVSGKRIKNPVHLSKTNGWSYRWQNLPEGAYSVTEEHIPKGYTVKVTKDSEGGENLSQRTRPEARENGVIPVTKGNTYRKTEFYKPGPLGILGGFHLVGFDSITSKTHINGNLCTGEFRIQNTTQNFGTNDLKDVSYVRRFVFPKALPKWKTIQAGGIDKDTGAPLPSVLVVGEEACIGHVSRYDKRWTIDHRLVDRPDANTNPNGLWQDGEEKFVCLEEEKAHAESISRNLVQYEDTETVKKTRHSSGIMEVEILEDRKCHIIHLSEKDLESVQTLKVTHFPKDRKVTVVINTEVTGEEMALPGLRIVYEDGQMAPVDEVVEWQNANLIWNFVKDKAPYKGLVSTTPGRVLTGLLQIGRAHV